MFLSTDIDIICDKFVYRYLFMCRDYEVFVLIVTWVCIGAIIGARIKGAM